MKILLLGNSQILQRRVLPALLQISEITRFDLASSRPVSAFPVPQQRQGDIFSSYEEAIAKSPAEIVYVSLINSAHSEWVERALASGRHVVVDKPALENLAQAQKMIALARDKRLCLAEATVYEFHAQINKIRSLFGANQTIPKRIFAQFTIPPLEDSNFRYRRSAGGGALLDLGPYAVSLARIFFGDLPESVQAKCLSFGNEVETAFSVLITFSKSRSFVGHFGFDADYTNHVRWTSDNLSVWADRVFTTGVDASNEIHFKAGAKPGSIVVPPSDSFGEFFLRVLGSVKTKNYEQWYNNLEWDALVREKLDIACRAQS